jgi:hypothetical protein
LIKPSVNGLKIRSKVVASDFKLKVDVEKSFYRPKAWDCSGSPRLSGATSGKPTPRLKKT